MTSSVEPIGLTPQLRALVLEVLPHFGLEHEGEEAVLGRDKFKNHTDARSVCYYVARRTTTLSFPEIARCFERHDHTTIMSACKRVARLLEHDPDGHVARVTKVILSSFVGFDSGRDENSGARWVELGEAPLAKIEIDEERELLGAVG